MSGIGFGITCPELVLESHVLESHVRNWFCNHTSWNQASGIGIGINLNVGGSIGGSIGGALGGALGGAASLFGAAFSKYLFRIVLHQPSHAK